MNRRTVPPYAVVPFPQTLIKLKDAARSLSLSVDMVRRLAHAGEIPYVRLRTFGKARSKKHGLLMFTYEDLQHFAERNRTVQS